MKKIYSIQIEDLQTGELVYREFVVEDKYIPSGMEEIVQDMVNTLQDKDF